MKSGGVCVGRPPFGAHAPVERSSITYAANMEGCPPPDNSSRPKPGDFRLKRPCLYRPPRSSFSLHAQRVNCSFYRGVGMRGWVGGEDGTKVMVFEVDMPHCDVEGDSDCTWDRPAIWALNARVSRPGYHVEAWVFRVVVWRAQT